MCAASPGLKDLAQLQNVPGDLAVQVLSMSASTLTLLLEAITLYNNYFRPCVMLVGKEKRSNGKSYRCRYDQPRTPAQRALESA